MAGAGDRQPGPRQPDRRRVQHLQLRERRRLRRRKAAPAGRQPAFRGAQPHVQPSPVARRGEGGLLTVMRKTAAAALYLLLASCAPAAPPVTAPQAAPASVHVPLLVDDLQERTFRYFWDQAGPGNGLIPDRWPTPSFSSVAAVGFGLTAYPVGIERGWITRDEGRARVLETLRFLKDAPEGPEPAGRTSYKGFFYHFLDMKTGARFEQVELSTIDTTLLLAGVLFCQSYFDQKIPEEEEIRSLAEELYRRVDWQWART